MSVLAAQARPALHPMQHPHDFRFNSQHPADASLEHSKQPTFRQHLQNARLQLARSRAVAVPLSSTQKPATSYQHYGTDSSGAVPPEDLLRRKTPSGIVHGAYNGSVAESHDVRAHAAKHVLVTRPRVSRQGSNGYASAEGAGQWQNPENYYTKSSPGVLPGNQIQVDSMIGLSPHAHTPTYGAMDWQYTNQSCPHVMQPPYQAGFGPTVSNEPNKSGPYWPNGEFEPYRPAAYSNHFHRPTQQPSTWSTPPSMHDRPHAAFNGQANTPPHLENGCDHRLNGSGARLNLQNASSKFASSRTFGVHPEKLSFSARSRLLAQESRQNSPASLNCLSQQSSQNVTSLSTPGTPWSPVGQSPFSNKDVLSWAYRIYNDLVGSMRESRRSAEKVAREMQARGQSATATLARSSQVRQKQSPFPTLHVNASDIPSNGFGSKPVDPHSGVPQQDPKQEAYNAVNTLNNLCSHGDRDWVDGMLVNGCLSHLLGEYQNAARWYCRILQVDANHAEAASNLAATYSALNRTAEAEECWRLAVRLRPTYFEAVEHLVGLLCQDKRNKEAIQIIDHVQAVLQSRANFEAQQHAMYTGQLPLRYACSPSDNGRMIALIHAKGNLMYNMQDQVGAARAFEEVVLVAVGCPSGGIEILIRHILNTLSAFNPNNSAKGPGQHALLLPPEKALQTAKLCFSQRDTLPGLEPLQSTAARRAAVSVTSNALLSLAKIFQDGMNSASATGFKSSYTIEEILALYYLSLSLQPSPSTANNVGILLASIQQTPGTKPPQTTDGVNFPGVVPGGGIALALTYYKYGLSIDQKHAHLYTNLGSLLKDIGQLQYAVQMYERAVACDGNFDIALANLANAVKDQGRVTDAITYYRRAVQANPKFPEAVCGLANALNSICEWHGRGGMKLKNGKFDRWHVSEAGELKDTISSEDNGSGWISRVVDIVEGQLREGQNWGRGSLRDNYIDNISDQAGALELRNPIRKFKEISFDAAQVKQLLESWRGQAWEGAQTVWLIERVTKMIGWQWYHDRYTLGREQDPAAYQRPRLPDNLSMLGAPTVLPFHTFTLPMTAKQVRQISQRNGLRVSFSTLKTGWLPKMVYPPPSPPAPTLKIGYVSSDFNNHPLAHLMQSVFGMHDQTQYEAYCYATSASDNSIHRQQIERESPHFIDASSWPVERVISQIVQDGIHILINLNGYTRGARNEIFAARPAPVQMSFMGFAGSLGAEWCDYLLADETAVPEAALRPYRNNVDVADVVAAENTGGNDDWVYTENIVYARNAFFCCDHAQSACANPTLERQLGWSDELSRRWRMRMELFPDLPIDTIIMANFNQLYKIDPTTFRTWLRILSRVPNSVLWLLRFPADGAFNLQRTAKQWAGAAVASRIRFTDVAPKGQHIARACVADLFLDTNECNAHTTAADCLWSGTPLLTLPRYEWKMCSRMAAGIVSGALNLDTPDGQQARNELVAENEDDYENKAVKLANDLTYSFDGTQEMPMGTGRLMELRRMLWRGRWTSKLFDTRRWVRDLELAYSEVWRKWVEGEGGDVWIKDLV